MQRDNAGLRDTRFPNDFLKVWDEVLFERTGFLMPEDFNGRCRRVENGFGNPDSCD
jgi:hypothetical protein